MEVNFGGTRHLIEAVKKLGQDDTTRFVYIGTVAKTGDRMPPIHWDRVSCFFLPLSYEPAPFLLAEFLYLSGIIPLFF